MNRRSNKDRDLSTGEASKISGMSTIKLSQLIDAGQIPGAYHVPGSKFRRIPPESLRRWMLSLGIPEDAVGGFGLTTGEAAGLLQVSLYKVNLLFDSGRMPGAVLLPGTEFRRIPGVVLVRLMNEMGMDEALQDPIKAKLRARGLLAEEEKKD